MAHEQPHSAPAPAGPRLPQVGAIIAVASGKGGVGKSTVAVNLACALSRLGHKTGLLDADIYGPSQHIMVGLKEQSPVLNDNKKIVPIKKFDLDLMSFGFFVKAEEAVIWRGPMISRMLQQFVDDVAWGPMDYLVVDLPPGTGDIQLTLTQHLHVTGAVIVTTPQDVALADVVKGINMFRKVNVDILGVIENMSTFACPHCGKETPIFSTGGGEKKAAEMEAPFLGKIPLEAETRESGDAGIPIVIKKPESPQAKRFMDIAARVVLKSAEVKKNKPVPLPSAGSFSV
ncbi:MAG: Mrp/NBP35 family ATP-binding protein [Deltaproteobacteria bacterium]|nr:Mrp/NBP35 family ATP-binding protein [Deltaproteobacteria bacterium]